MAHRSSPVTDDMVERAWAAIVGSDVAAACFNASIIRADLRDALEAVIIAQRRLTADQQYALERMAGHDLQASGLTWDNDRLLIQSAAQAAKDILEAFGSTQAHAQCAPEAKLAAAADEIERPGEDASGWTGADKHNPYRRS